jgi:hypothetical protein
LHHCLEWFLDLFFGSCVKKCQQGALPGDTAMVQGISSSRWWTGEGRKTRTRELPGWRRSAYSLSREPVTRIPRCVQSSVASAAGTERHHHTVLCHKMDKTKSTQMEAAREAKIGRIYGGWGFRTRRKQIRMEIPDRNRRFLGLR